MHERSSRNSARRGATILGISGLYHDSAAALVCDGRIVAASQEERFTRKKHDAGFPLNAAHFCLKQASMTLDEVDYVVFYDKPLLKFERLLETYVEFAPDGFFSFSTAMPVWLTEKLFIKSLLRKNLGTLRVATQGFGQPPSRDRSNPEILFDQHHRSHAASAFFPSPFERAAVLCLDGVGEWATTSVWMGEGNQLRPLWQIDFPHSLGLLYSAFTSFVGFKVNSGEYKLMGLAPYGQPRFVDQIRNHLITMLDDGTFRLNMKYFGFATGLRMTKRSFAKLFGVPIRTPNEPIEQVHMDLAASVQAVTEEIVLKLARTIQMETGANSLCLAGGVALNCVANGKLIRASIFDHVWIQPAAGDAGGALGAALDCHYTHLSQPRKIEGGRDAMRGGFLGPSFSNEKIASYLESVGAVFQKLEDPALFDFVAEKIDRGNVVGWFQGEMEFGPRALGARSILGDARNPRIQSTMNLKIKFRESFRPFAPAVLKERAEDLFELSSASPYMLVVAPVAQSQRIETGLETSYKTGFDLLNVTRSKIPAVTHVDGSARIQTVDVNENPRFHALLSAFDRRTGCPALVNTSFNVRGEPIVCTPEDAFRCFMRTEIDILVLENFVLLRSQQPQSPDPNEWREEFELD